MAELTDYIEVEGKKFPKIAVKEELEELGAVNIRREDGKEYMIIEKNYAVVWQKSENGTYNLHLYMPKVLRFS